MASDLISRSALKKYLRDYKWEFALGSDFSKAMEMVDAQPTAYNVDAVVEQLEKNLLHSVDAKAEASIAMSGVSMNMYYGEETAYTKAIEIVKAGGV